jgi:ABC-type lipoprotein export system ATPase subunit
MIQMTNIHKTYQMGDVEVRALRGVTLTIEPGEFIAVMGPSGSGKSTLMHVLGLLDVPDSGSYKLWDREVSKLSENELAQLRSSAFGFVFQQFHLLPRTTAIENVGLPLLYQAGGGRDGAGASRRRLEAVGLGDRLEHKPNELSGGQQQRVAIARAIVTDPAVLLADEPTGNLDTKTSREIMELVTSLNRDQGITVIMVTHETDIAAYAERVVRFLDGKVEADAHRKEAA